MHPTDEDLPRAFARAVGGRLAHVTATVNLPGIRQNGLMSASDLTRQAGIDPARILLRADRREIGQATLNHQKPILHGLRAARAMLEDHTPESWAAQLDARVFLWPAAKITRFTASLNRTIPASILWIDLVPHRLTQ